MFINIFKYDFYIKITFNFDFMWKMYIFTVDCCLLRRVVVMH